MEDRNKDNEEMVKKTIRKMFRKEEIIEEREER